MGSRKIKRTNLYKKYKRFLHGMLAGILILCCIPVISATVKADYVTDDIGVYVGYPGLELSDYVLVDDWHISEIESLLPVYNYAYSFFDQDALQPSKYRYIVDSARGILVKDLLDLANIYYGDIYNLNFYVLDHEGMWCAFDRDSLFDGNRYYFDNLPGHRIIKYKTYKKSENNEIDQIETGSAVSLMEESNDIEERDETEYTSGLDRVSLMEESGGDGSVSEEPGSQEPQSEEPESQEPESQEPQSEEPESQEPESQEPQSEEPASQEPQSQEPESQEPESKEPETVTDYSVILGYDFSECWNYCEPVPPLLAIEDNWTEYTEEFESARPDWSYLNTGSRFRLLYGQYSPTDSNTRDSAKYVRYVYVTLNSSPKIVDKGEQKPIETKIGAKDTLEFEVSDVYNQDMQELLTEYMNFYSTDESVIVITGVRTEQIEGYVDRANVFVSYEVVGEGTASIGGGFGTSEGASITPQAVTTKEGTIDGSAEESDNTSDMTNDKDEKEESAKPDSQKQDENKPTVPGNEDHKDSNAGSGGNSGNNSGGSDDKTSVARNDTEKTTEAAVESPKNDLNEAEAKLAEAEIEAAEVKEGKTVIYQLSEDMKKKLDALKDNQIVVQQVPVTEEVQQLQVEDNTEQKENRAKTILIWTGIGCLGMCVIGGAAEYAGFRTRLKKNLFRKRSST